ncbi:hypothetical protein N431DRAFT_467567 [Stipitochalara longipes BDJ]|nr:hypothetical protein N431DRAFT_467567 [Stipitochalara longipes BDJ]
MPSPHAGKKLPRPVSIKVVKVLLECGANPNECYQGATPWQNVLPYIYASLPTSALTIEDGEQVDTWLEICKLFLQHGADTHVCCQPGKKFGTSDRNSLLAREVPALSFSKSMIFKWMESDALLVQKGEQKKGWWILQLATTASARSSGSF